MKALSVKQPFAWAIVNGRKDIENRKWITHFRGRIAIHACGVKMPRPPWPRSVARPNDDELITSAIVGVVDIVDVVETSRSKWFLGPLGWVLANARPLATPIPCKGNLKLWDVPPEIEREIERQLSEPTTAV